MLELLVMAYPTRSSSVPPGMRVRNQRTQALIRRDAIWQIGVPLGLSLLIVIVLMTWLVTTLIFNFPVGASTSSVWADISLIFLILVTGFMGLVVALLLGALVYGLTYALRELPYYFKIAQDWMALATYRINNGAEKIAGVFMSIRAFGAGVNRAGKDVRSIFTVRRIS